MSERLPLPSHISASTRKLNPHLYAQGANDNPPRPSTPPNAEQRQRPSPLARNLEAQASGARCPLVRFTLRRVSMLDVDAKYASCKDLLDGLQYAGLIPGDKEGEIELEVTQERVRSFKDEETEIVIEMREEAP